MLLNEPDRLSRATASCWTQTANRKPQTANCELRTANCELEQAVAERTTALRSSSLELEAVRDAYQRLSETDELTRLGNRRNFEKEFERAMALVHRLERPLALLMVDIDYF